jgi:hypothetical protein
MAFPFIPILIGAGIGAGLGALGSSGDKKNKGKKIGISAALGGLTGGLGSMLFPATSIAPSIATQASNLAGSGAIGSAVSQAAGASLPNVTLPTLGKAVAKETAKKGFFSGLSSMDKAQLGLAAMSSLRGNNQEAQPIESGGVNFPGVQLSEAPIAPMTGGGSPYIQSPALEEIRRRQILGGMQWPY